MRSLTVAIAVLVVCGSLAGILSAGVLSAGVTSTDPVSETDAQSELHARAPPDLPEEWRETYGGEGDDIFADLVRTADGGYLLVGWSERETTEGWVVKIDGDGAKQWERTLGGSGTDRFWGVVSTEEGYLLAGRTDTESGPEGWVVELGPEGEPQAERTTGPGAFNAIARTDSSYLLAGWTSGDSGVEGLVLGLDGDLSQDWKQSYSTPDSHQNGYLRAVVPTDSGYYLAGKAESQSNGDDAWALKLADDGTLQWQTTAGGPARDDVWAAAPASAENSTSNQNASTDAGFVIAGETESDSTGPRDGWLVKFADDGTVEWERKPGGEGTQWLDSAMQTEEGYLFTGGSDAGPKGSVDGYVLKTNDDGTTQWEQYYGTNGWDKPWPAIRAHDGGYLLAGQTSGGSSTTKDGWLLRIGAESTTSDSDRDGTSDDDGPDSTEKTDDTVTDDATTDDSPSGDSTPDDSTPDDSTTDSALQGDTNDETTNSEGGVPGFGFGMALLGLVAFLLSAAVFRFAGQH